MQDVNEEWRAVISAAEKLNSAADVKAACGIRNYDGTSDDDDKKISSITSGTVDEKELKTPTRILTSTIVDCVAGPHNWMKTIFSFSSALYMPPQTPVAICKNSRLLRRTKHEW